MQYDAVRCTIRFENFSSGGKNLNLRILHKTLTIHVIQNQNMSRSNKVLNQDNRHYARRIRDSRRLWFDNSMFAGDDDFESHFDPYTDFDPFNYMFFEDEYE